MAFDPEKFVYMGGNEEVTMQAVKAGDIDPNSFLRFLDPFGKTMAGLGSESDVLLTLDKKEKGRFEKHDAFENYMLIRLPEWLGGGKDDISAFRSYHAVSLSDNCLSRYWPSEGRWRIENPCAGDIYRPWDGLAVAGPASRGYVGGNSLKGDTIPHCKSSGSRSTRKVILLPSGQTTVLTETAFRGMGEHCLPQP